MTYSGRVLIVDDNLSFAKTLSSILRRFGYDVATANDGLSSLYKLSREPFDLIFMDIKMPHLNGVETYKRMKHIRRDIKIIMMTAYTGDARVKEALAEGALGILYKPLDIRKLRRLLDQLPLRDQPIGIDE